MVKRCFGLPCVLEKSLSFLDLTESDRFLDMAVSLDLSKAGLVIAAESAGCGNEKNLTW